MASVVTGAESSPPPSESPRLQAQLGPTEQATQEIAAQQLLQQPAPAACAPPSCEPASCAQASCAPPSCAQASCGPVSCEPATVVPFSWRKLLGQLNEIYKGERQPEEGKKIDSDRLKTQYLEIIPKLEEKHPGIESYAEGFNYWDETGIDEVRKRIFVTKLGHLKRFIQRANNSI